VSKVRLSSMLIALSIWSGAGGCATDGEQLDEPADSDDGFCDEQPMLTWETFGQAFFLENCQACHGSEAINRFGAPEAVSFDTEAQTWEWVERIVSRALDGDVETGPDMPPSGGVPEEERFKLEVWLRCDAPN
jgi:hypothetical protein